MAVLVALEERLERHRARQRGAMTGRLARLVADVRSMPVADGRPAEEALGYDETRLPR